MAQTLLNFSIVSTGERLTLQGREIVLGKIPKLNVIEVYKLCDTYLPQPTLDKKIESSLYYILTPI